MVSVLSKLDIGLLTSIWSQDLSWLRNLCWTITIRWKCENLTLKLESLSNFGFLQVFIIFIELREFSWILVDFYKSEQLTSRALHVTRIECWGASSCKKPSDVRRTSATSPMRCTRPSVSIGWLGWSSIAIVIVAGFSSMRQWSSSMVTT